MESTSPAEAPAPARPSRLAVFLLLFLLPLGFGTIGSVHGHGQGYVPDTHIVRCALGMAKDRDPVPPVGRYSTYPNLLPYMLVPVYAGYYAVGLARDDWRNSRLFGEHVLLEPGGVHLLARWLVALLSALTPWVVYRCARSAGLTRGAFVSGWLVATCLLVTQFATQERPWAPMTLFIAASAWGAVAYVRDGRRRQLLASGVCAGLAFATHQAGLGALGISGLAWVFGPGGWSRAALWPRVRTGFLTVLAFAVVSLLLGHPYLLVHGRTATEAVVGGEQLAQQGGFSIGGMSIQLHLRWQSAARLVRVLLGYDPALLALGLAGLLVAARRRALAPVTIWTLGWAFFFLTNPSDHVRYLLPVLVLLAVPAGFAAERLLARGRLAHALLALGCALPLVQSARFVQLLTGRDTRADFEDELLRLPLGARVAIDRYGPEVDLSALALTRLRDLRGARGDGLYARERHRLGQLNRGELDMEEEGFDVLPVEDVLDFDERESEVTVRPGLEQYGGDARTLLRALGVTHLLLVERRTREPHLLADLVRGTDPIWELDPGSRGPAPEAFLPLEMEFPLTALWSVSRPGPRLLLYELAGWR